ncbi:hypothetical protein BJ956_001693 [Arthrobacter psychrochitiniphilus]|nr:hypothetical protein [Arthrobacter psychrochitiniphilus]
MNSSAAAPDSHDGVERRLLVPHSRQLPLQSSGSFGTGALDRDQ